MFSVRLVFAAPIICVIALCKGHPYPFKPFENAFFALCRLAARDLTRLIVAAKVLINALYCFISTPLKMIVNIIGLTVGRVTGWFGVDSGHVMHEVMCQVHVAFQKIGQFFNPGRLLKSVQVAHPNYTVRAIELSYKPYLAELSKSTKYADARELIRREVEKASSPNRGSPPVSLVNSGTEGGSRLFANPNGVELVPVANHIVQEAPNMSSKA